MLISHERYQTVKKITLIRALGNVVLAVVKIIFAILGHSHALLADGLHSLADLLIDALVLFASRFSSRAADIDHPYGHQRIETAATMGLAALLILTGAGIIWDAITHLLSSTTEIPKFYVIFVAIFSILVNEGLYYFTRYYGRKIKSNLLIANAWHHRSDSLSSLVVLVGVAIALLGYAYLDELAAIIVGLLIIHMGWSLGWESIRELVDTGVSPEYLNKIKQVIFTVPGVESIHELRTRSMANNILIDVHITVNPFLTVSEGHYIAATVDKTLHACLENVTDVTVHIDVENDQISSQTKLLPPRKDLLQQCMQYWEKLSCPGFQNIQKVNIHYLGGKVDLEIYLPCELLAQHSPESIQSSYKTALKNIQIVKNVNVIFNSSQNSL